MTIINVCNLFSPIVGPLIGIINIIILIILGSMRSTNTNGKNHVLPIDSGTPTEPKRRTPVNLMHYVYCLLLLKICKFVLF